ncbi:heterokaryon incompatibility protein-domain-containing protein, partial [Phaeosphaeriaceae sp. PMI808]
MQDDDEGNGNDGHDLEHGQRVKPLFRHRPLDTSHDSIRVLQVLCDQDDGIVQCEIRHTRVSDAEYDCLSYTWQPSLPAHEIEINGGSFDVGDNLFQFLRAFRTFAHNNPEVRLAVPLLWIDAICINQTESTEKNHQVQQMGAIYKSARKVYVWLG